jgi:SH3 domain-containing YSC84-like protein 1
MRKLSCITLFLFIALPGLSARAQQKEVARLQNAGETMKEILNVPDDIPQDLLDKADCVIVIPSVVKFAFFLGGSYGRGVMTCRKSPDFTGPWGAPTMMALEGASFGLQFGGQATDLVLLVMNDRGAESILSSKVKLGVDVSAAAGPKGRYAGAATDVAFRAEVLSYSRSRGLFAGISLSGASLRPDNYANERLYGKNLTAKQIALEGKVAAPGGAEELLSVLDRASPKNLSS